MKSNAVERINLPESAPYTMVYIDRYEDHMPHGEFVNSYLDAPASFSGFCDLILKLDNLYDYLDFPRADRADRFFLKHRQPDYDRLAPYIKRYYNFVPMHEKRNKKGMLLTFLIKTRFRLHGSWQGTMIWIDEDPVSRRFISTLQCMKLMDEALRAVLDQTGLDCIS